MKITISMIHRHSSRTFPLLDTIAGTPADMADHVAQALPHSRPFLQALFEQMEEHEEGYDVYLGMDEYGREWRASTFAPNHRTEQRIMLSVRNGTELMMSRVFPRSEAEDLLTALGTGAASHARLKDTGEVVVVADDIHYMFTTVDN